MFTIIGGDGKEYGPASVEQIRGWIAGGRANLDTKAKAVGTEEWRRLGEFPEFAPAADTPPPLEGDVAPVVAVDLLADRWARLGAWLIDQALAFMALLPGMTILGFEVFAAVMRGRTDLSAAPPGRVLLGATLLGIGGLILLVVQCVLLSTRGQTVGKRVVGIRIVRYRDGENPGFVSAVLMRGFIPGLIGAIPYLGFIFTLVDICFIFRQDRRCVHDFIAGTRVVKV